MRISYDQGIFRAIHITGPTHNYLGLRLNSAPAVYPAETRVLPAVGAVQAAPLSPDEVAIWIKDGIAAANEQLGTSYVFTYAEVVANDSRLPEVYKDLATRIVLFANGHP